MDYDKLIEHLRRRGLGNGCVLGPHSGLYDEAATDIEAFRADLRRLQAERDTLLAANQHLMAEREQLTAERDAAMECIETVYAKILIK